MRFLAFPQRNTDPTVPAAWIDYPMAVLEDAVCSPEEENDRWLFGELVCSQDWDDPERSAWLFEEAR